MTVLVGIHRDGMTRTEWLSGIGIGGMETGVGGTLSPTTTDGKMGIGKDRTCPWIPTFAKGRKKC